MCDCVNNDCSTRPSKLESLLKELEHANAGYEDLLMELRHILDRVDSVCTTPVQEDVLYKKPLSNSIFDRLITNILSYNFRNRRLKEIVEALKKII